MPSVHDTAYPRLKAAVTARDLAAVYTPTPEEQALAATLTPNVTSQVGFCAQDLSAPGVLYGLTTQGIPWTQRAWPV
jgi:hypothetical protein